MSFVKMPFNNAGDADGVGGLRLGGFAASLRMTVEKFLFIAGASSLRMTVARFCSTSQLDNFYTSITMFSCASMRARQLGGTTVVALYSATIAGPANASPGRSSSRW